MAEIGLLKKRDGKDHGMPGIDLLKKCDEAGRLRGKSAEVKSSGFNACALPSENGSSLAQSNDDCLR